MPLADWMQQLAATAMLGTERAGDSTPAIPSEQAINALVTGLSPTPPEHALLASAAVAAVCSRAGTLPTIAPPFPLPAELDPRLPLSPTSVRHLSLLLSGHYPDVLPEFLDLVDSSHRGLPPKHLPALLQLAKCDTILRPRILATLGSRGHWLAAQNPEWAALSDSPSADHFHTGTMPQRLAVLNHLRKASPSEARALIISTWSEEKPEDRAAFIQTIAINLSTEDEPFLESALDDKRKEVRTTAVYLLTALTDSRFARRMIERLTPLVTVTKKPPGKAAINIEVPESLDAAATRDGISPKSTRFGLGEKASQLVEMISATPLRFWTDITQADSSAFLTQISKLEWKDAVFQGLIAATIRQKNIPFATALLTHQFPSASTDKWFDSPDLDSLINTLTPAIRESLLTPFLADKNFCGSSRLLHLLVACRHPWSIPFSEQFLPYLWHFIESDTRNHAANHAISTTFPLSANPAILSSIAARLTANPSLRPDSLEKFLATLQFRHDLHKEF